jgi:hypothetical protein
MPWFEREDASDRFDEDARVAPNSAHTAALSDAEVLRVAGRFLAGRPRP